MEYERYPPAGKWTIPPPAPAAASIALLIAAVSSALPSPAAPNDFTSNAPATGVAAPAVSLIIALSATPDRPIAACRKNSLRQLFSRIVLERRNSHCLRYR